MTPRAISAAVATALATEFDRLDGPWRHAEMAEAFASVVGPDRAEALADRVLSLMPLEPIDRRDSLCALLIELPKLPETLIPLVREPARLLFGVPELPDLRALATMLNLTPSELDWFADRGSWLRTAREPLSHYRYRRLPKSTGHRLVEAPKPRLREIQRTIARRILANIPAHPACHGFETGCSAATFAAPHAQSDVVIRMDLRDFFSTIGVARVRAVYRACGYSDDVARALADLCTTATALNPLRGLDHHQQSLLKTPHLPQGAPTSPRLANLIAHNLDRRIAGYARRHHLTYTRYADDLALSGTTATNPAATIWSLTTIAHSEGFTIHPTKTLVRHQHQRQTLAGLVVNSHPNVPRPRYDEVRALLHNCQITGPTPQNHQHHPNFRAHIYGLIAWIGETSPTRRQHLLTMADQINWD